MCRRGRIQIRLSRLIMANETPAHRTEGDSSLLEGQGASPLRGLGSRNGSYLVDPASSHMLVSKIKPCMSKYKRFDTVKLRMAH